MTDSRIIEKAKEVWEIESQAIKQLIDRVDYESFIKVVHLLSSHKGRVITCGVGTSGVAARKGAHTLSCVNISTLFLNPADAVHGALGVVQKGDIVFLLSKGGGSKEIVQLISPLKEKGATIIAITENQESQLAKESDIILSVKVEKEADSFNMLATSSTLAVIAMFDALSVSVMELTHYSKEQFAVIHPSGAVGQRLLKKDELI
ncbi:MAG: SIS domain-containing protein [Spirochaetia bacterium]|nr:SIS domain-containing protein [Spirochaetia bacterium]